MTVMDRYLARAVFLPTLMALALLVVLNCVYLFIDEQSSIGQGAYSMAMALRYVALNVPQQIFDLTPVAALLGAMIGLGDLARRSEIIAFRAAGVSVARLALTLCGVGVVVMLFTAFIGEYIAPETTVIARQQRAAARTEHEDTLQGTMLWVHEDGRYIRIETAGARKRSPSVTTFDVAADGTRLTGIGRANDVSIGTGDTWRLQRYLRLLYGDGGVRQVIEPVFMLHMKSGSALLDVATEPSDRSVAELAKLVRQFHADKQDARPFVFALWSRVARTVASLWCVLLALPFAFGGLRSAHAGVRIFVAVGIGIVFVLSQQLVESGAVLSNLPPVVLAWLPTGLLAIVTSLLVLRVR